MSAKPSRPAREKAAVGWIPNRVPSSIDACTDHAKSIEQAENLDLVEFQVRYLVVMPVWITLAERFLIDHFRPVWNTVIEGFGNHPPGRGRRDMRRPRWDLVHPGRPWAAKLQAAETGEEIVRLIGTPAR